MIEHSASIAKLAQALGTAQAELSGVKKDSVNPHFKNRYASLESVIAEIRDPLTRAGLCWIQAPGQLIDGALEITTMLLHTSGEWLRSTFHIPLGKRDPQGAGSAITYACRYALMAMLGLPAIDDDGEDTKGAPSTGVGRSEHPTDLRVSKERFIWQCCKQISQFTDVDKMRAWWQSEDMQKSLRDFELDQVEINRLKQEAVRRSNAIADGAKDARA